MSRLSTVSAVLLFGLLPLRAEDPVADKKEGRYEWKKVHDLPDYVYFNHSAHVTRGVGCVTCHARIDQMEEVYQAQPLSMGWCLDCHRSPDLNLRPPTEVTNMTWKAPGDPAAYGKTLREQNHIAPPTDCSTCHR